MSYSPGWRCAMRPPGSPEELQRRRERALALLRQGYPPVEVAERVGVDRRSVRRWKAAVRERGAKALRAQPVPGRPRKLDAPSLKELKRDLLKGAQAAGFPTDLWTCPRITKLIRSRFGVHYQVSGVWRLLRALDWSPQKPERRAVERNEREIQRWSKRNGLALKKSLPAEGASGFPRRNRLSDDPSGVSHLGSSRPDPRFLSTRRVPSEGLLYWRAGRASPTPPTSLLLPFAPEREHQHGSSPGLSPATAPPVARKPRGDLG